MTDGAAGTDDLLATVVDALPGGQERPAQREMADAVAAAFRTRRHVAVQGPTGVGKTLAYLLPAIATACDGHRTVVVTSTRALQDQLAGHDLPLLEGLLGDRAPFSWAVLKGRSNYLCAAALDEVVRDLARARGDAPEGEQQDLGLDGDAAAPEPALDLDDDDVRAEVDHIIEWAGSTDSGDAAELSAAPRPAVWSAVSVGPGECVGAANCSFAEQCWSEAAREAADEADVVVVNAHLYGAHLATGRTLLAEHDQLVIDEAHAFEDSIVGSLSVEMTEGRLTNLARVHRRCIAEDDKVVASLRSAGRRLGTALAATATGPGAVRLRDGVEGDIAAALALAVSGADRSLNGLRRAAKAAAGSSARHRLERAVRTAEGVLGDAQTLLGDLGAGAVCWVEPMRSGRHALRLTRIDVADTLRTLAWDDADLTVVACSATLDPGTPTRLGLDASYLSVPSPFDFANRAMLYVPRLVRPNHPDWPEQVAGVIEHLIRRLDGRTLALFTSRRMLEATSQRCAELLGDDHEILVQGDAPNPVLQAAFLEREHASLFATASFWTGMSSPGTTCSAVVVDKLPFPVPTDPIVEARGELVGADRAFSEVSVPAAGLQLAQGVGRLIRTVEDRGVVAVCDPRLAESGYRSRILELLPPMRRERNPVALDRFIDALELPPRDAGRDAGRSRPEPVDASGAGS